ncbi:MAG: EamA family transporter [Burkholderiaceae bacterium]
MTGIHEAVVIGLSVLMHVTWNLIARHQPRHSEPLWWVLLGHLVLIAPWGLYQFVVEAQWSPRLLGLLLVSACANVLYFQSLSRAYQHAPVAFVYPLVRNSPLLIAVWSLLFLGESLGALAWTGIGISVVGLLAMAQTARGNGEGRALPWTLLAMLATSVYSLSDKAATACVPGFGGILGYLSVGYLAAWASMCWRLHRSTGRWTPGARPGSVALLVGSLCVGLAYALVIHAMRTLPAAEVVAYTNAGIALATVLSLALFHERTRWLQRSLATLVICVGLACIGIGRALSA